jgi:hypothetical protein
MEFILSFAHMTRTPRLLFVMAIVTLFIGAPAVARADGTIFMGAALDPAVPVRGASVTLSMLVVGLELEYSMVPEDLADERPTRQEGAASLMVQTPTGRTKLYGLAGVSLYRERLDGETTDDGLRLHVGGGVKFAIAGPLGIRLDYRVSKPTGDTGSLRHRFYGGLNLAF